MQAHPWSGSFIGSDSLLVHCAEIWLARGHDVRTVITAAPRIADWARERGVPVVDASADLGAALAGEPFDYLFAITHLQPLPDELISLPRRAAIRFHDGPLPRYAGLYTPAWAVIQREPRHGISWHVVAPGEGHGECEGDILEERSFELRPDETALTVNTKCFEAAIESFGALVSALTDGEVRRRTPDRTQRRYHAADERPEAACTLRCSQSAAEIDALVRALDFGPYENPLGLAKLAHGGRVFAVTRCRIETGPSGAAPGTLLGFDDAELRVAAADGTVALSGFSTLGGEPVAASAVVTELGLVPGNRLDALDPAVAERLTRLHRELATSEGEWQQRLAQLEPLEIPYATGKRGRGGARASFELALPDAARAALAPMAPADAATAVLAAFLSRMAGKQRCDVAFADAGLRAAVSEVSPWVATAVPMRIEAPAGAGLRGLGDALGAELAALRRLGTYPRDAVARKPELRARPELRADTALPVAIVQGTASEAHAAAPGASVCFAVSIDGGSCTCSYDPEALPPRAASALKSQLAAWLEDLGRRPDARLGELSLLSPDDRRRILHDWNETAVPVRDVCVHQLVEEQAERTPDAVAVVCEGRELRYRELDVRANRLAHRLRELGVGPDRLVGVCIERSLELVVAILAVHKAGGAYVPLDPAYPRERLAFMLEDSRASVLLTQAALRESLPPHGARVLCVDADDAAPAAAPENEPPDSGVRRHHLAYVIYTSGSTGKPKGVMVEHRNVVNFFHGMDPVIAHDPPGTFCAVTSLSFDISVLELLWTLARGFKVVVYRERERVAYAGTRAPAPARKLDFSLFMWGADDRASAGKYDLMLRAARFADERGFAAVWTPERHFHAFGGAYPNPSVTGAAIAAITSRIQVRAGSCVVPLHHPARVAEEWAVVDNLSNGRVGISFASGWQPDDFLLRPESFKDSKRVMAESIDQVRRLWRGEKLAFMGPLGKPVEIVTQPRPVQKELPFWVTTAGSPETYRLAGAMGANVLTHLLGQTVEEVGEKIRVYRKAREEAGFDPDTGIVSLMLHTFVGEDVDEVRALVREPMKSYLRSSVTLIKNFAWAFPAFKRPPGQAARPEDIDLSSLTPEELDAILEFAFERYFETSGLFGTPETCLRMIDRVRAAGVDDIACLIDFGVATEQVASALAHLDTVRRRANETVLEQDAGGDQDFSLPAQIARHRVTHMQCTPSMARMLLMSDAGRRALRSLQHLMVGGEALPVALARDLLELSGPTITNMYGPTETTIWSSTHRVTTPSEPIPIGRPIANTRMYVLDGDLSPLPVGMPGELYIGGAGVVRGYHERPELTAERFVVDPHAHGEHARMYRTGDLARWREDGAIEFLGRGDHQVKIRGFRIELGEIETALGEHPSVREAVVLAREDTPGDQRLVAYVVAADGSPAPAAERLREVLRARLPEHMVPAHFVMLERLPLTPNGKVDRRALPAPDALAAPPRADYVAPQNELEQAIAAAWCETLGLPRVGVRDNFFDLGGHSLLVVRLHRRLQPVVPRPLSLTDLYRFPTVAALAAHLTAQDPGKAALQHGEDRAKLRFEMRKRRARDARQ